MFRRIDDHQFVTESLDDVMAARAIVFICGLVAAIFQSFCSPLELTLQRVTTVYLKRLHCTGFSCFLDTSMHSHAWRFHREHLKPFTL